nr:unnamed protein product [Callosobruchus analis]
MHTDLAEHLHSEKCNEFIKLLQACHIEYPFRKFLGRCNSLDSDMLRCLKAERIERRNRNMEKSKETKRKVSELLRKDMND